MIEQVFTFGYGQECPYTGRKLADHYATIIAPDRETARALMIGLFGQVWSLQYESADDATRGGRYPMTEHVRIDLTRGASAILVDLRTMAQNWAAFGADTVGASALAAAGRDVLRILDKDGAP